MKFDSSNPAACKALIASAMTELGYCPTALRHAPSTLMIWQEAPASTSLFTIGNRILALQI